MPYPTRRATPDWPPEQHLEDLMAAEAAEEAARHDAVVHARPFLKWPGGKRQLLPALTAAVPAGVIEHYAEPFLGGGALFFALAHRIVHARLSDANVELITTYTVVRDQPTALIAAVHEHLRAWRDSPRGTYYYAIRGAEPLEPLDVAARMIFLNRTGFNGLYRVNRAGKFNVAEGDPHSRLDTIAQSIRYASAALAVADLSVADFGATSPVEDEVVYADPPYDRTWTNYTIGGFNRTAQLRLRDAATRWRRAHAHVVLSNADTPFIRDAYADWRLTPATARRSISPTLAGRTPAPELIIH